MLTHITTGSYNSGFGFRALDSNQGGSDNTAVGAGALLNNTIGGGNTAVGFQALDHNIDGRNNTADGNQALHSNTTGSLNTATGVNALFHNNADYNTADGFDALFSNTTGQKNTATGVVALVNNTTGCDNTATGFQALFSNIGGYGNAATGAAALYSNTWGTYNTAIGSYALQSNTTGQYNTATGTNALRYHQIGVGNTASGGAALYNNQNSILNTADGYGALYNSTGDNNTALGSLAGSYLTTGDNNIDISNYGIAAESNTIRIGAQGTQTATYIAGISGIGVDGSQVYVNPSGQLGVIVSSERFKKDISAMGKASEAILALKPVSFHYKTDAKNIPQFGLIAEEVVKVNRALVTLDTAGKPYTVRYDAVNAMLLNEFLKGHRKVREQEGTIAALQSAMATQAAALMELRDNFQSKFAEQQKQIEELTASRQKVNAPIQASRPVPQVAFNDQ